MSENIVDFSRREFIKLASVGLVSSLIPGCRSLSTSKHLNILFIIVDDLRPELGCYGNKEIVTPHFDSFAKEGMVFRRAYCQAAACSPSRASIMTGLRPDSTRVWSLGEEFRKTIPDVVTMPQHFHKFGYYTVSMGKIFHNHMPDRVSFDEPDLRPPEYNSPELIDRDPESFYHDEEIQKELARVRERRIQKNPNAYAGGWAYGQSTESVDAPDDALYDGAQTDLAINTLKRLTGEKQPFFMALGYYRPHLPFVAPKKYWDLYEREKISMASNPYIPIHAPIMAVDGIGELRACYDLEWVKAPHEAQLPEETARLLKHGYYASVSYIDACLGRVLRALGKFGLEKNTIVVVWGDHGWKLGEHGSWCKQTNYNIDTRVPLMIRAPSIRSRSNDYDQLVELVDVYPSLCEMAGIEVPAYLEGTSFLPLLNDPARNWKSAVFSQYHRPPYVSPDKKRYMGYSMVTRRYHYVEWRYWDNDKKAAGDLAAIELYDNESDPDENRNMADIPENAALLDKLAQQLQAGWRAAIPT